MKKNLIDEMIETRRTIHKMPEEGWTEFETTYLVYQRLKSLGYTDIRLGTQIINPEFVMGRDEVIVEAAIKRSVSHGVPLDFIENKLQRYTGCIAVLNTNRPGPTTALRFDMDCNPVQETADPEHLPNKLQFASEHPGYMHACGHDAHTAVGLAVARWAMENIEQLRGTIKFIFQPSEEGVRGAVSIVKSGILDDVNIIMAGHCGGISKLTEVGLTHRGMMASTKFDIRFKGTPSHTGNAPHKGHSALLAASATAMMLVGITRHGDGASRIAVGRMTAGEGRNVTPVNAYIQGEVRGETAEINDFMMDKVRKIVEGNALAYEVEASIKIVGQATTLPECPKLLDDIREIAQSIPSISKIHELTIPSGSEDYTHMMRRVVDKGGQAAFWRWGCNHHGHHRGDFDIQDTVSMPIAFEVTQRFISKTNGIL